MADGVDITAGSGTTIATDDVGGVQYQRTKLVWGTDGTVNDASASNPLPVTAPAASRVTHSIAAGMQTDAIMNNLTALTPKFFSATVAASQTDSQLIALVSAKKLRIIALAAQCAGTPTEATFESSTTTRKHKIPAGTAGGGQVLPPNPWGWFETAAGESLTVTTGSGSSYEISGTYVEV